MTTQFGVTSTGWVTKKQQDIITEMKSSLQSAFGKNLNFAPSSNFGQMVGIMSEREALVWELAEAVYNSQFPGGAEGTSVDNLLALSNLRRLVPMPTKTSPTIGSTYGLVFLGTVGTLIPKDSIISVLGNASLQFTTDADYTIAAAVNAVQTILFSSVPDSGSFAIKLGGTLGPVTGSLPYTSNSTAIQNALTALTGFSGVTVSGTFSTGFTITFAGSAGAQAQPTAIISSNTLQTGATVVNTSVIGVAIGSPSQATGFATATVNGPNYVAANALSVIGSPVSGWTSVTNPLDCVTGSFVEGDTAAIQRRSTSLNTSANGPVQAIAAKVRLVTGVTQVTPFENLGLTVDGNGLPGKSFQIVVDGGLDASIAQAIWGSKPTGIQSFGSTTENVSDSFGNIYPISFSRPTPVTIYVLINITAKASGASKFPSDGVPTIQQDIVAIGNALGIGDDVILFGSNGIVGAFNSVPGILSYALYAGTAPSPIGQINIPISAQQRASFETFNVIVNLTLV